MTLATRSLASTSTKAAHLWRSLQKATTQEEIDRYASNHRFAGQLGITITILTVQRLAVFPSDTL